VVVLLGSAFFEPSISLGFIFEHYTANHKDQWTGLQPHNCGQMEACTTSMKRQKSHYSKIGIFGKAVVTATLFGCTAIPQGVIADQANDTSVASGVYVTILSPKVQSSDPTKQIEISAFYQAAPITGGVTSLELYIDGQQEAVKTLDSPETRGVVSFVIAAGALSSGSHQIVVRVAAIDAEVASAKTGLDVADPAAQQNAPAPALGGTTDDGSAPMVAIMSPDPNADINGVVTIKVDAHDNSGKSPYVSLFIDHNFKTLRNFPPYDFAWDTTRVANGYHTIEVWGYNDDQAVGHAQPLTVYVNNPGGRTLVRHDLLDTVPTKRLVAPERAAAVAVHHALNPVHRAASLAKGSSISAHLSKLASATTDATGETLSEEAQLMSPFLPSAPPAMVVKERAPAVRTHIGPSLAGRASVAALQSHDQLSSITTISPDLSGVAQLTAPTIETFAPAPHVLETAIAPKIVKQPISSPTVLKLNSAPVEVAKAVAPPGLASTSEQTTPYPSLDVPSYSADSDDQSTGALETPSVTIPQVSQRALLAMGKSTADITLGETKIASASLPSSLPFSPSSALVTPEIPSHRVLSFITTHRVAARLEPLGASREGFSVATVSRFQLVMNNHLLLLSQPLQDRKSFLFAPLRQIFESEGGVLAWNPSLRQVHALSATRDIQLTIGSKSAMVNQQIITLNAIPYLTRGHTMVPLAFIPVALNATVSYDPASGHIVINSND